MCPKDINTGGGFNTMNDIQEPIGMSNPNAGAHTFIAQPSANMGGFNPANMGYNNGPDLSGPTKMRPQEPAPSVGIASGGHTVIRRPGAAAGVNKQGRKLVGFLVTYNHDPMGKSYNLYEGRNFIGRDSSCDICIGDDTQMSGRHMSILYRSVDDKFKFRDEQSSNGTFVNKELLDEGELQNYDIIRVGSTLFIFIAIPKIG
jgi:hypothetical protein